MVLKIKEITLEGIIFTVLRNKVLFFGLCALCFTIFISFITINFFSVQKRATQSAELAIGFSLLQEKKKDEALYRFQKVFNETDSTYKLIAGSGVISSLKGANESEEKSLKVLEILKNYNKNIFLSMLIQSAYFSLVSPLDQNLTKSALFSGFEKSVLKSKNPLFIEQMANVYLNINDKTEFKKLVSQIKQDKSPEQSGDFPSVSERAAFFTSL